MSEGAFTASMFLTLHVLIQIALIMRVLLRPHREPASRIAWIVVIIILPALGILAYILFGETNIGRRRVERMRRICRPMCRNTMRTCFKWENRSTASTPSAATGRT